MYSCDRKLAVVRLPFDISCFTIMKLMLYVGACTTEARYYHSVDDVDELRVAARTNTYNFTTEECIVVLCTCAMGHIGGSCA